MNYKFKKKFEGMNFLNLFELVTLTTRYKKS